MVNYEDLNNTYIAEKDHIEIRPRVKNENKEEDTVETVETLCSSHRSS